MNTAVVNAMLEKNLAIFGLLAGSLMLAACGENPQDIDDAAHRVEITNWQEERAAGLVSEDGWLTLVGLCWLEPGMNSFGSARGSDCHVAYEKMPARIGNFERTPAGVVFIAANTGMVTTADGSAVNRIGMVGDHHKGTTLLAHESLRFYMIERFGDLGIRVRDLESEARREFEGLEYFPIDKAWRKIARFEPYPEPQGIPIINILGMRDEMRSPGELVFEHDGEEYRLIALAEDDDSRWFVMIADATSGEQTYGAGRYIYVDPATALPGKQPTTVLDLNKLYNPPCAFTALATCPLPPMQNRLALPITAGEKNYASEAGWHGTPE